MISWNDCDTRIGDHGFRVARTERIGHLASSPLADFRPRIGAATVVAQLHHRLTSVLARAGGSFAESGRTVEVN